LISIILIFLLAQSTYYIDKKLISKNSNPIFAVKVDSGNVEVSTRYLGIGYEVIHWNTIKDGENNSIIGYEIYRFPNSKDDIDAEPNGVFE